MSKKTKNEKRIAKLEKKLGALREEESRRVKAKFSLVKKGKKIRLEITLDVKRAEQFLGLLEGDDHGRFDNILFATDDALGAAVDKGWINE